MGLKRQILLALERRKNDYPGLSASNAEQILEEYALSNDAAALYAGPGTSSAAPGTAASTGRVFFRIGMIEEALVFGGQASLNLSNQLPAGSVVMCASLNFDTAIVLATGVKVGLGIAATPNQLALSGTVLNKNVKTDNALVGQVYNAAQTIQIASTDTNGAAAGSVTSGTVRARVIYRYAQSISDAP